MGTIKLLIGLAGALLLGNACIAQDQDPASPRAGNGERGRELLGFLGPRPASGFSPLQQQALAGRVRCAAIRQQIQDELDVEATGSISLYAMSELRVEERENCISMGPQASGVQAPQPMPQQVQAPSWQPPRPPVVTAPPPQAPPQQARVPQTSAPVRPAASAAPPVVSQPTKPVAPGPAYTPAPDYPDDENAAGHEGVVMVQMVVNPDGTMASATVAKSSGFPALDAAALVAARKWRIPAAAGKTIDVPLSFTAH